MGGFQTVERTQNEDGGATTVRLSEYGRGFSRVGLALGERDRGRAQQVEIRGPRD